MKNIINILCGASFIVLLSSCSKEPIACFEIDSNTQIVGGYVRVTNCSSEAKRFEWDFGDGTIYNNSMPTHQYSTPGNYEIKLTVKSGFKKDVTTETVEVLPSGGGEFSVCIYYCFL